MATAKQYLVGILLITLLVSGAVYVAWPDAGVRVRVDNDKSTFYIKEGGRWLISGVEYNSLWDGTTKMNRISDSLQVTIFTDNETNITTINRYTTYIRGPQIIDTYIFDSNNEEIELFPVSHTIQIINGSGYIYQYEVRELDYNGLTIKNIPPPVNFGKKMTVEWGPGWYWSTVYKTGLLKVRYRVTADDQTFTAKLYDPNSPPEILTVTISPTNLIDDANVLAYVTATDADGTNLNITCTWYVNDANVSTSTQYEYTVGSLTASTYEIDYSAVLGGQDYKLLYTWTSPANNTVVYNFTHNVTGPTNEFAYVYYLITYEDATTLRLYDRNVRGGTESFTETNTDLTQDVASIKMYGYTSGTAEFGSAKLIDINYGYIAPVNVANLSSASISTDDEVYASCYADDFTDTSSALNSSTKTVYSGSSYVVTAAFADSEYSVGDLSNLTCTVSFDGTATESYCYQEYYNISTACGGLATGSMSQDANWSYIEDTFDGDWNDGGFNGYADRSLYLNYTKPENATNESLWVVKGGDSIKINLTLGNDCWNYDANKVVFRLYSLSAGLTTDWNCYNGTDWKVLRHTDGGSRVFYEEAMWWYVTGLSYDYNLTTNFYVNGALDTTSTTQQSELVTNTSFDTSGASLNDVLVGGCKTNISAELNATSITLGGISVTTSAIYQDGTIANRTYEEGTSVNLSVLCASGIANVTIYSSLNNSGSETLSCGGVTGNVSSLIDVSDQYESIVRQNVSKTTQLTWSYSSWENVTSVRLYLESTAETLTNVTFFLNGVANKVLYGVLNGAYLNTSTFSDFETEATAFFTDVITSYTFYVDASTNPAAWINLTLASFVADSEELDFDEPFRNSSEIDATITNASYPYFTIDDLETNSGEWTDVGDFDTNEYSSTNERWDFYSHVNVKVTYGGSGTTEDSQTGHVSHTLINVDDYETFGVRAYCDVRGTGGDLGNHNCVGSGTADCWMGVTSDTSDADPFVSTIQLHGYGNDDCKINDVPVYTNCRFNGIIWFYRQATNSTSWDAYTGTTFLKTIVIPTGNQYITMKGSTYVGIGTCGVADATVDGYIEDIYLGGAGASTLGNNDYNTSFEAVSTMLHNTSTNITATYLDAQVLDPNDAITFYLSADNGSTWEETDNPSFHVFEDSGKYLKWKALGVSTTNASPYGVGRVSLDITQSSPANVTFDIGADGTYEFSQTGEFNTTTDLNISDVGSVSYYIDSSCDGDKCLIPITITSDSIGGIVLSQLSFVSYASPVSLTSSAFPDSGTVTINNSDDSDTKLVVSGGKITFSGDADTIPIYVERQYTNGTISTETVHIDARYSPFTVGSLTTYPEFFPTSATQYNITPYSQTASVSFYNFTTANTDHTTNIYARLYETLPNCMSLRASDTATQNGSYTVTLNSIGQTIGDLDSDIDLWLYLDMVSCTTGASFDLIFDSLCDTCVSTVDFDEGFYS